MGFRREMVIGLKMISSMSLETVQKARYGCRGMSEFPSLYDGCSPVRKSWVRVPWNPNASKAWMLPKIGYSCRLRQGTLIATPHLDIVFNQCAVKISYRLGKDSRILWYVTESVA